MSTPAPMPDRRRAERTQMSRLAYIHIEPDNGAIVLNVSAEGLCFHSMAAVERNARFCFSLLEQNRKISACGDLAWTDDTRKIGGVKFTTLTTDAHEQIQSWIDPRSDDGRKTSTLGSAFLQIFPSLDTLRFHKRTDSASASMSATQLLKLRVRLKLSGFSGGLATGFLVSLLVVAAFLAAYTHRNQLGESLIHFGERLAGKSSAPPVSPPVRAVVSQAQTQIQDQHRSQISNQAEEPKRPVLQPLMVQPPTAQSPIVKSKPSEPKPSELKPKPQIADVIQVHSQAGVLRQSAIRTPVEAERPAPPAFAPPRSSPAPDAIASTSVAPALPTLASRVLVPGSSQQIATLPSMYFDLGKFKDEFFAQSIRDKVAKLGLRANLVRKGHLWMNSFQVLVGPYTEEDEAKKVHRELLSQGYKPRPFERGSRNFSFVSAVTLNGTKLPTGDVTINWESYVATANVNFSQTGDVVTKTNGRWITGRPRYQNDEYVYEKSPNGARVLLEIHFRGMDRALVFRN